MGAYSPVHQDYFTDVLSIQWRNTDEVKYIHSLADFGEDQFADFKCKLPANNWIIVIISDSASDVQSVRKLLL